MSAKRSVKERCAAWHAQLAKCAQMCCSLDAKAIRHPWILNRAHWIKSKRFLYALDEKLTCHLAVTVLTALPAAERKLGDIPFGSRMQYSVEGIMLNVVFIKI